MRRVGGSGAVGDLPDVADLVWAAEHLCALEVVRMSNDGTPRRLGHCGDSEGRGDLAGVYEAGRWCARGADGGNEDERGGGGVLWDPGEVDALYSRSTSRDWWVRAKVAGRQSNRRGGLFGAA